MHWSGGSGSSSRQDVPGEGDGRTRSVGICARLARGPDKSHGPNRVVADEYAAVSAKIDALYAQPPALSAPTTRALAWPGCAAKRTPVCSATGRVWAPPGRADCCLESVGETCAFRTGTEFLPILVHQRDHVCDHGQADRPALFDGLIRHVETGPATTERS
jgi:hypothetical protein